MKGGWETKSLEEVCRVVNGGTPRTRVAAYWGGEHQWLTPKEMGKAETPFVDRTERSLTSEGLSSSSARLVPADSVILSTRAPIGHLAINTVPMAFNQGCRGLVPEPGIIRAKYIYYFLMHSHDLLQRLGSGTTFKELSATRLKQIAIPVPPISEQERIVRILDQALAGIDQARANTEANLVNADHLVARFFEQAISEAEAGLPLVHFGEVLAVQPRNGWSPPAAKQAPSGTPVLTLSAVTGFHYDGSKVKYTRLVPPTGAHCWLVPGDLLMTRSNTPRLVGHVAIYDGMPEPVIYPDLIMRMRPDPALMRTDYAYWVLRTIRSRAFLTSRAGGASQTMSKIKKGDVQQLPLAVPSLAVQEDTVGVIARLVDRVASLTSNLEAEATSLDSCRAALLDAAFAGRL